MEIIPAKINHVLCTSILVSMLILFFSPMEPRVFGETQKETLWNIRGHAIRNTITKSSQSKPMVIMGAFSTTEEPTTEPIPLTYEYPTFSKFYVGIVVINTGERDKDITVTFELSGIRSGKEDAEFTIPRESTFLAYINDTLARPGFYTYKASIKNVGSSKITLMLTE
ncbi:MAG: hypothetical protein HS132_05010 [Planctomycetia bacterium]|nr:hypothetical protein [Planctomycetia bacterium]